MKSIRLCRAASFAAACVMAVLAAQPARAQTYKVLHTFTSGTDGANPYAGVIRDAKGNLYGATTLGGTDGLGTVFKVSNAGEETVLYGFTGGADGANPYAGVIQDAKGDLYGTTEVDGTHSLGTVFKLSKIGKETVLWNFMAGNDGGLPKGG